MKVAAFLVLLSTSALAAPGTPDVAGAAARTARVLDGVLRSCPASFARVGSAQKQCVGVDRSVESARTRLGLALGTDLYGVWRSRDDQRSVYNWVRTPGGYVYLRVQPDPGGRARTLVYLDAPPQDAPKTAAAARPSGRVSVTSGAKANRSSPRTAAPSLAPVSFTRSLALSTPRLNGQDVRAVQDRLIALTRPSRGGQGDGWYGPVTARTVRAFQAANGLPVTGRVDRATWDALFSPAARTFAADGVQ